MKNLSRGLFFLVALLALTSNAFASSETIRLNCFRWQL